VNGRDSNDGSADHPWATLTHAGNVVGPGATVHVAPGTYVELDLHTNASGTPIARVRYISDVKWAAHFVTNGWINYGDYVDLLGFEISGTSTANYGMIIYANEVHVLGNRIHDVPAPGCTSDGGGGVFNQGSGGFVISGNWIYDIGYPGNTQPCVRVHGIYLSAGRGGTITNNIIYNNAAWGIKEANDCSGLTLANVQTVNNTVYNNQYGGIHIGGGTSTNPTTGMYVANNIVQNNGSGAGASGYGVDEGAADPNIGCYIGTNTYIDNVVYNNAPSNWLVCTSVSGGCLGTTQITGTVNSDALMVNPSGTPLDFHLQSSSPAINTGTSTNAPIVDFDGGVRPQGGYSDIGAYEYGASPGTWPWF
jgi:parallel beta-helix repeat protein